MHLNCFQVHFLLMVGRPQVLCTRIKKLWLKKQKSPQIDFSRNPLFSISLPLTQYALFTFVSAELGRFSFRESKSSYL